MSKVVNIDLKDNADTSIIEMGIELLSNELGSEMEIYETLVARLNSGSLSVRGGKATIKAINEIGDLPSIAETSIQYLLTSNAVRKLEGGKGEPIKKVIGVATQGVRKFGKSEFDAIVAQKMTYSALAKKVENQPAKEKASAEKIKDMDTLMKKFLDGMGEIEDILPTDPKITKEFFQKVKVIESAIRATHPAKGSKAA